MAEKILTALKKKFDTVILRTESRLGDEVVYVPPEKLLEVAAFLRDEPTMSFDSPVFCTCIDHFGKEPRFEVCYQLRSLRHGHRIRIKICVKEEEPNIPTLSGIWPGFNWQERETFDMYGIHFDGHPDLRRIYMYDEFVGYPLRKDYPKDKRQPLVRRSPEN